MKGNIRFGAEESPQLQKDAHGDALLLCIIPIGTHTFIPRKPHGQRKHHKDLDLGFISANIY